MDLNWVYDAALHYVSADSSLTEGNQLFTEKQGEKPDEKVLLTQRLQ